MKGTRKAVAMALSIAMACTAAGCSKGPETKAPSASDVEVWSTYVTEKVLRDVPYGGVHGPASLDIEMYGNEVEGMQLIITPSVDISRYTFEVGDLTDGAGHTIGSRQISIYHEKYVEVSTNTLNNDLRGFTTGWYPDAMLPFDKAVEYNENTIASGDNQGILVEVKTAKDQAAGKYTGTGKLDLDGLKLDIPVNVTVWDWALPDENHLRSVFASGTVWSDGGRFTGELDSTWEMHEKYNQALLDFRLCDHYLTYGNTQSGAGADLDKWIVSAIEAGKDPRCSTFVLPYRVSGRNIDRNFYEEVMVALMNASIENDVDIFAKAVTYFTQFDEAIGSGGETWHDDRIQWATNSLTTARQWHDSVSTASGKAEFKARFTSVEGYDETKFEKYYYSMQHITQLMVGAAPGERFKQAHPECDLEALNATLCPTFDQYNDDTNRLRYLDQPDQPYGGERELWWYGCVTPKNPYPTYQIDDWGYSPRVVSWEQYKYGVTGNLFWSVDAWVDANKAPVTSTVGAGEPFQDLYNAASQYPTVNGDGYLFYPGKYYGIDGPVSSLRIHEIRDGMEDYEAMYALGDLTDAQLAAAGIEDGSAAKALTEIFDSLFDGTVINTDSEKVYNARRAVAKLLAAAKDGVVVYDCTTDGENYIYKVYAPAGTELTSSDSAPVDAPQGGKTHTVTVKSGAGAKLEFSYSGKTVSIPLSSRRKTVTFADLKTNAQVATGDATDADETKFTATLNGAEAKYIRIMAALFGDIDPSKASVRVRVKADRAGSLEIRIRGTKSSTESPFRTVNLAANTEQELNLQLSTALWVPLGKLSELRFYYTPTGDMAEPVTITVSGMSVKA